MTGQPIPQALRRTGRAALLAAWLLIGTTACGTGDTARPLTQEEAQRLALARLTVYETGPAAVRLRVPTADAEVGVDAVVDYAAHRASGSYSALGHNSRVAWDQAAVSVAPGTVSAGQQPVARPGAATRWSRRPYTRDPLDRALRLVLALGSDRPENAQLLAQSGPRWLGEKRLRGRVYTLFAGPRPARAPEGRGARTPDGAKPSGSSPVTYWVDERGALGRVEARLASGEEPMTVDFTGQHRSPLPPGPWPSATTPPP
ncbi:hypothetical protein AB0G73_16670 [Streptomyces sp. NPDC020719]|uniref:hypothetical protein n=1 Tax=Streptomyces sp. NPDC020719 TaxID=3154896 RepID=UPI0033D5EFA1